MKLSPIRKRGRNTTYMVLVGQKPHRLPASNTQMRMTCLNTFSLPTVPTVLSSASSPARVRGFQLAQRLARPTLPRLPTGMLTPEQACSHLRPLMPIPPLPTLRVDIPQRHHILPLIAVQPKRNNCQAREKS